MTAANSQFSVVRANEASCEDLQAIFGARGAGAWCQCQRYKLRPGEAFARFSDLRRDGANGATRS